MEEAIKISVTFVVATAHLHQHAREQRGQLATAQGTQHYWCGPGIKTKLAQTTALKTCKNEGGGSMGPTRMARTRLSLGTSLSSWP